MFTTDAVRINRSARADNDLTAHLAARLTALAAGFVPEVMRGGVFRQQVTSKRSMQTRVPREDPVLRGNPGINLICFNKS